MRKRETKRAGPKPLTVPKRPRKICARGHRQAWNWKGPDCVHCIREDTYARSSAGAIEERARWAGQLGPAPRVLELRDFHGRLVSRHVGLAKPRARR